MSGNYFCHVCGGLVDLIKLQPSDVRLCECEKRFARLRAENKMLAEELNEQARLFGISAEKELALRAENERLKAELDEAKKDADIFQWLQDNHVRAQAFFWNYQSRKQRRKAILEAMKGK